MYTLYFLPDACSLAIHSILNELKLPLKLINRQDATDFQRLNPALTVPVLTSEDQVLNEGVAIVLYLLELHDNNLLPPSGLQRQRALENMMFANASMHPAYGRLFFIESAVTEETARQQAFAAAADSISMLWRAVEVRLQGKPYLGGEQVSPADFFLAVYSRWGAAFPVEIEMGVNTQAMIGRVLARDSVQRALQQEQEFTAYAG